MRRRGLLTAIILGMFVLTGYAQAQNVSVFSRKRPMVEHRYGIQVTGNYGTYVMQDVNDFRAGSDHTNVGNELSANQGVAWGIAILYRSEQHFRWSIGYSALGRDKTYGSWDNLTDGERGSNEQSVFGSEFYVMGSYLITFSEALNVSLGFGPAIYRGTMDRNSSSTLSIYDAKGRSLGFRAVAGIELVVAKNLSLNLMGGYRYAKINELRYEDTSGNEKILYHTTGSNRTMRLDFSGIVLEGGVRMYFEPATGWFKF